MSHIGSIGDDAGSFCTDNLGGLYVTGSFNGTVDFDPGSKIRSMTSFGANGIINTNAFIQYLDSTGNLIWFKTFLGLSINSFSASSNSFSNTIAKNSNNDIFIAGHFNGTIDANPGLDTNKITEYGWPGNINNLSDAYLIKLRNVEVCSTTNKCGIYRQNDSCYADYPYTDAKNSDCVVYQNTKCSNPDAWDFCRYNCTSWVAWCINKAHGYTDTIKTNQHFFSDYKVNNIPTHLGPAIDWLPALFKLGYKVDNSPQVGAIAWWNNHKNDPDGGGGIGVDGHVAYVSCVKGDSVTLTEFNFSPFCYYDIRIVDNSLPFKAGNRKPDSFIHIESSPVGLLDNNTPEKIQIYPNPTDGIVNLKIEVTTNTAIRIEILNIIGKKEYELSGYSTKMGYSTIISFTNLANGVYFLQLYTNNNIFTKKIIVQR